MVMRQSRPQQTIYNEKYGSSPPVSEKWGGEANGMAKLFGYGNIVW